MTAVPVEALGRLPGSAPMLTIIEVQFLMLCGPAFKGWGMFSVTASDKRPKLNCRMRGGLAWEPDSCLGARYWGNPRLPLSHVPVHSFRRRALSLPAVSGAGPLLQTP